MAVAFILKQCQSAWMSRAAALAPISSHLQCIQKRNLQLSSIGADAKQAPPVSAGAASIPDKQSWLFKLVEDDDGTRFERDTIINVPGDLVGAPPRLDLLHRVIVWQRREWWQGTAKAKGRAEVRGGGRKPWRQKGTGRARVSSIRNPLWRGGGVVHGPRPRDHSIKIPQKVHKMALRVALSVKYAQGNMLIVDNFNVNSISTRRTYHALRDSGVLAPTLFVDAGAPPEKFVLSTRNIPDTESISQEDISVYKLLTKHELVITRAALDALFDRLVPKPKEIQPINVPREDLLGAN